MNGPLTPRERAQLNAALVLLKRGEVKLASRVLDQSVKDTALLNDIRAFMKSCEAPAATLPDTLTWEMTREDPEQWFGRGLPQFDYMLVGHRNGNYSVYRHYFSAIEERWMIGLIKDLRFYLPYEEAKAKCEEHFRTVMQPAVPA